MIPPILSQTWKSQDLPAEGARLAATWRALNPELEYRLYDDDDARNVVAEAFPDFLGDYERLPLPILKADVFRYAVLWRDGGIYADIDMECLRPISHLLAHGTCLFSIEAHLTAKRQAELNYSRPIQIANCIMAAPPRSRLFASLVKHAISCVRAAPDIAPANVEDITGPRMLTRFLLAGRHADIHILPQIILMAPLHYPFVFPLSRHMHARHRTFGTWKTAGPQPSLRRRFIERNRWPGPFPRHMKYEL